MTKRRTPDLDPLYAESGTEGVKIRLSKKALRRIEWLAATYAGGNLSLWIRYGALEAPRRHLVAPPAQKRGRKQPKKGGF